MIERLELKNFTAFTDLALDFSPKINVIIGENGTGKTHLLKAAYGLCAGAAIFKDKPKASKKELESALTNKLLRLFLPLEDRLGKMRRRGVAENAHMEAIFSIDKTIAVSFHTNSKSLAIKNYRNYEKFNDEAVFIPTKEVLSLVRGITDQDHDQQTIELVFDDGYLDLAGALMHSGKEETENRIDSDPRFNAIIPKLVNLVGGRYQWGNGGFCFQPGQYKEKADPKRSKAKTAQMYQDSTVTEFVAASGDLYSSGMTAEGFRKVGILHRLLSNGKLDPGSSGPLFWDEPESNLNPKLMKDLVEVLLELARNGQQIVLASHDFVLLKWFDLLMDKGQGDHVRFHSLFRHESSGEIKVASTDNYSAISKSAISDAFAELYDEDVKRALG